MALVNPNIALGIRQPEFTPRNAMAEYAQMQQVMNAQDAQQMNALKMQEAQATMQERNALRRLNPSASDFEDQLFRVNPTLGIQYRKERTAAEASAAAAAASRAAAEKSGFELSASRRKFGEDLKRGLSANPSDENIVAFGQDAVLQGLYSKDQVEATVSQLLAMPLAERVRVLSQAGASPSELKPTINVGPTGLVRTSAFGGDATVVPGTGAAFQMTPAQIAQNAIAQQQLNVSQGNLRVAQDKFAFEKANPGFELKESADGTIYAVNKRTLQATPVTVGGAAPAPGGVASDAAVPGTPLKGKANKDIAVSEQQASYNLGRILDAAKEINAALKKDPNALKPGMGEASAASVGLSGTANVARSAQRQIVYGAQRDALDAMLYLATGAAYNKEQLEGQMAAYVPAFTDKPDAVEAKRVRMLGLIQNAKVRAGKAWTPEMDAASQALLLPVASSAKPAGGNKPPAAPGASNVTKERADANAAIAAGAPVDAVRARFKQNTGQEF